MCRIRAGIISKILPPFLKIIFSVALKAKNGSDVVCRNVPQSCRDPNLNEKAKNILGLFG
jgi:hypothetical protein